MIDFDKLQLPEEITVAEAAEILDVSARTVKRYIEDGLLVARNIAPLRSKQATFRIPLTAVIELRTQYVPQAVPKPSRAPARPRSRSYQPQTLSRKPH